MKKLEDHNLEQPHIDRETFYTRYTFEYKTRHIDVRQFSFAPPYPSNSSKAKARNQLLHLLNTLRS